MIRGEVEREIQALVSKRDNVHTHHPYHAWDPVPSLSAASAGNSKLSPRQLLHSLHTSVHIFLLDLLFFNLLKQKYPFGLNSVHMFFSWHADQPREAAASD